MPADSLSGDCVAGALNEPINCGYGNNLIGLCSHCARSSPNATDTCCYTANVGSRCEGVDLPPITALPPLFPTATGSPSPTGAPSNTASATAAPASAEGLTGGQVAGVVVGVVVGLALLIGLLVFFWIHRRRRRRSLGGSVFNQPSPPRMGAPPVMAFQPAPPPPPVATSPQQGYEVLPGGRIARMSALEGPSDSSSPPSGVGTSGRTKSRNHPPNFSSSSEYEESPESRTGPDRVPLQAPPPLGRRQGSLSSASGHARDGTYSSPPTASAGEHSSPPGVASQQSEQLTSFKDYYSTDEIHPGDRVSTLWAYQPRAPDEFELERGDMLKVVGIWDDGWATGVRLRSRAEDWEAGARKRPRDSQGSSSSDGRASPPTPSKIKAFPVS